MGKWYFQDDIQILLPEIRNGSYLIYRHINRNDEKFGISIEVKKELDGDYLKAVTIKIPKILYEAILDYVESGLDYQNYLVKDKELCNSGKKGGVKVGG